MLNWIEINTPSIHGITRLRCGLYLCIENVPGSWQAVKMGMWESAKGLSREQAQEESELHYLTERLKGSKYRPNNRNIQAGGINKVWHHNNGHTSIPPVHIEGRVNEWEDSHPHDPSMDES